MRALIGVWDVINSYGVQHFNQQPEDEDLEALWHCPCYLVLVRREARRYNILCVPGVCVLRGFIFVLIFTSGYLDCDFRIESYPCRIANRHLKLQTYSLTMAM